MRRNNLCDSNPEWLRAAEEMVVDTVLFFRNRGHRRDTAIEQGALALGLTSRKAWSLFYQQPVAIAREEYQQIRRAFIGTWTNRPMTSPADPKRRG